jgi:Ca2+-binding RTX toxin-like protein
MAAPDGPGRFALGSSFALVKAFFEDANLPPGSYTKAALGAKYGLSFYGLNLQQANIDDGRGDYAERTFIWGTVAFQITDSATFVVDANGTKHIDNFGIEPLKINGVATDNFDFTSSNPLTQLGGTLILQPNLDPSEIGRKVIIQFTGQVSTTSYTKTNYDNDVLKAKTFVNPSSLTLYSGISALEDALWNSGTTKFLDGSNRPIIYGTRANDALNERSAEKDSYLKPYVVNGIVYVAGSGDDFLLDTTGSDVMLGGADRDTADYSKGGVSLTLGTTTYSYKGVPTPATSVQVDARAGVDLLVGMEKIQLSSEANTVKVVDAANLNSLEEINGAAGRDTLDFSQMTAGVTIANQEFVATHTKFINFEKIVGTSSNDRIDYSSGAVKIEVYGGAGEDNIKTGAGDDLLDGGANADVLEGGGGFDQYIVTNGDTVKDSDGRGSVTLGGRLLTGGKRTGDAGAFTSDSGDKYVWNGQGDLTIVSGGDTVTVSDFHNGSLGIYLKQTPKKQAFPLQPFKNPATSPLVLDLDGNGFDLSSTASGVHFDFGGDHFRELTGWVNSGDGLLVYDANHDGAISDTTELFGNATTEGFEVLSFYDGRTGGNYYSDPTGGTINGANGVIDANDAIFSQLRVWRDLNQDGIAQAAELTSLTDESIVRINLNHTAPDAETEFNAELVGNRISQVATFEKLDGSSAAIGDAWFSVDQGDTVYDGPAVAALENWPDLHGYGTFDQLHNVLARNDTLKAEFRAFIDKVQDQPVSSLMPQFEKLMYAWAGIPEDYSVNRGEFIDSRLLAFLEKAYDQEYRQLHGWNEGTNAPGFVAAGTLKVIFHNAIASYFVKFVSQIPAFAASEGDAAGNTYTSKFGALAASLHYDPIDDSVEFDAAALASAMSSLDFNDPAAVQDALDIFGLLTIVKVYELKSDVEFYGELRDAFVSHGAAQLVPLIDSYRIYDTTPGSFYYMSGADGVYDQPIIGANFDKNVHYKIVQAGETVEHRQATSANYGADLYYVRPGLGTVTFQPERGLIQDKIILSSEFDGAPYTVERDVVTDDVRLVFATLGTTILLHSYLDIQALAGNKDWSTPYNNLIGQTIYFADGTVLQPTDIAELVIQSTDGNDVLKAIWLNQTVDGQAGNDIISGVGGSNTIIGGTGDDQLSGNGSQGVYIFNVGDGNDTISQSQGSTLQLNGIVPADIHLVRGGAGNSDLLITFAGHPGDSINILNEFGAPSIARVVFGDGTVWTLDDIQTRLILQNASDSNDVIIGFAGSDVLAGGRGNDVIQGAPSPFDAGDTYIYAAGDGNDTIIPSSTNTVDTLKLLGIRADQTTVTRNGADVVLTFSVPEGGSILIQDQFGQYGFHGLEKVVFSDGVVWSQRDFVTHTETPIATATIIGTSEAETLTGTSGNDGIDGLAGDDIMQGGAGSDTYFFGVGSGHDVIEDNGSGDYNNVDTVKLSLLPSDVELTRGATDVVIKVLATGETLTLANFFFGAYTTDHPSSQSVERLEFSDGTVWDVPEITANAWIRGTGANDTMTGSRDADTISGNAGDDLLHDMGGGDTYIIRQGDGHDTIDEGEFAGDFDVISFVDSTVDDVVFRAFFDQSIFPAIDQLIVERREGSASATFDRDGGIDAIRFSDGTIVTKQQVIDRAVFLGTDASETIHARSNSDDRLAGGKGDDELWGGAGSDTYKWSRGDGNDVIMDYSQPNDADTLHLSGISPSLVQLQRVAQPNGFGAPFYDLVVVINPLLATDAVETIRIVHAFDFYDTGSGNGIEFITFDDGTVWNRAQIAALTPLVGTSAGETIAGSEYADVISGEAGNDVLMGGLGNDTYVWNRGDGDDRIQDGSHDDLDALNTLKLRGVNSSDVKLIFNNDYESPDVLVHINATGEEIRLSNQLSGDGRGINRIVFDNGDVWDAAYIASHIEQPGGGATEGDDDIVGDSSDNEIAGLGGNDTIQGLAGDDYIEGNAGDDLIDGGDGDDVLDGGEGNDAVSYQSATAGVNVDLARTGWQDTGGAGVDHIANFETVIGSSFDDQLRGNAGNNTLIGLSGADTFVFSGVFGHDHVDFTVPEDVLKFSDTIFADVAAVMAAASQVGSDVVIDAGTNGSVTLMGVTLADLANAQIEILPTPSDVIIKPESIVNDGFGAAVAVGPEVFDLAANPDIGLSTTIPHASVLATASGQGKEYYSISLTAGDHVVFDIDQGSFDSVIQLLDASGNALATNDDDDGDPGSFGANSYLDYTVSASGTYFLSVGSYASNAPSGANLSSGDTYTLNISIEHQAAEGAPTDATLSGGSVAENAANGTVVGAVTGVDPDAGAVLTYALMDDAGGRFAIDATTGAITVANGALLNHEAAASHEVTVRVTDQGGLTFDKVLTLAVSNVNEAPSDAALTGGSVAENAANGTVVGTVTGVDPDAGAVLTYALTDDAGGRFAIDATTGAIMVANGAPLNHEAAASHEVTVRVTDQGGLTFDKSFTLNVTDVNEAPTGAALTGGSVAENAANGTVVGTVAGLDPDVGATLTYALTDNAGGRFAIDANTGQITVANGVLLDYETATSHDVTVRVTDQAGLALESAFTIAVTDVNETVNHAPTDATISGGSIAENANNGTVVGTVTGVDPDNGAILAYSLTDDAGGRFAINGTSGQITVVNGGLLDYESATSHSITVRVTDQGGLAFDKVFALNVTNVSGGTQNGTSANETLTGTAEEDVLNGLGDNDILNGLGGDDTLDGGAGNDTMNGGAGNDTYIVDAAGDVVTENANEGIDEVRTSLSSYTLGANVENVTATSSTGLTAGGNALNNVMTGNSGNDTLDGAAGADTLIGAAGNDTYIVDNAGDTVLENAEEGIDTVRTTLATYTLTSNVENLTYTGSASFAGTGNALNNILIGGTGLDTLYGGSGNDTFIVDSGSDVVIEYANEGIDLVQTAGANYTLSANVENLTHTGSSNFTGIGNALNNVMIGGAGNDYLIGLEGNDIFADSGGLNTFQGGIGDDIYAVQASADTVFEFADEGTDQVQTFLASYALPNNVENLTFIGPTAHTGTGNSQANVIIGAAGNDTLDGGLGADTLYGGAGNDTFIVDSGSDVVIEYASEGIDLVQTAGANYTLSANVENLTHTGSANFTGIGNSLNNVMIGGAGNDYLIGLEGNDTFADSGGLNTFQGGIGDDIYAVQASTDTVFEFADEGTDQVQTFLASYALPNNVENLTFIGSTAHTGTGNGGANVLLGNSGNDVLNGLAGNDTLTGGAGSDQFVFSSALSSNNNADQITDFSSGSDKIVLDRAIFSAIGSAGPLNASVFTTGAPDVDDRIIYNSSTGGLFYDADGSGAGAAIQFATLTNHPTLTVQDFQII